MGRGNKYFGPCFTWIGVCLACTCLFGCGLILGGSSSPTYYVLSQPECEHNSVSPSSNAKLIVSDILSSSFLNTQRIIYSNKPGTRNFYGKSLWAEVLPKRLSTLLLANLSCADVAQTLTARSTMVLADYQLVTELLEFYFDNTQKPPHVVISIKAELIKLHARALVASKNFETTQEVPQVNPGMVVKAFEFALGDVFEEMVGWLKENMSH